MYQVELDKINNYMKCNGLELSKEKTHLMLFNNGMNPKCLPKLKLGDADLEYKKETKFLGVYFTTKLNWKTHIEYLLNKTRKRLYFLKVISKQPWGQNTKTLIHLAVSLIRSKLIYGQEVYFSAPNYLLKKLQSLDSKALKIALGVPYHTNTLKCYRESNNLSLDQQRELAVAKYVVRSSSIKNSHTDEIRLDKCKDYPKNSSNISYLQPIKNYTDNIMQNCNVDIDTVKAHPIVPIIPPWEHLKANILTDYTSYTKKENINIVASEAKIQLHEKFQNHIKIFTDGSVATSGDSGFGFFIPCLDIKKSFYLGKGYSIFTSELCAILAALNCILETKIDMYQIVFCVDSLSVLQSLNNWDCKNRSDLIFDILFQINVLKLNGVNVEMIWIPSHVGIYGNEVADNLAKQGTILDNSVKKYHLSLSSREICVLFNTFSKKDLHKSNIISSTSSIPRSIMNIIMKLRLNSWATKFSKNISCCCSMDTKITIEHMIFQCPYLNNLYKENDISINKTNLKDILESELIYEIAQVIRKSDLFKFL